MQDRNTITYNLMISIYAKNGRIRDAHQLFDKMSCRNLVSWNTMISGYLHNDEFEGACLLFNKMCERDHFTWKLISLVIREVGILKRQENCLIYFLIREMLLVGML